MDTFTLAHVVISLIGIASGFIVVFGLIASKRLPLLTAVFLFTTVATSVTGFFFPFHKFLPSHAIGILSLVSLAFAILALYPRHLTGAWRWVYAVNVVISLYFNVFVLIAQLFQKVPVLAAIAPTRASAPFIIAQSLNMVLFIVLGIFSARRFHPAPVAI